MLRRVSQLSNTFDAPDAQPHPADTAPADNPALSPAILAALPRSEEVIYRALVEAAERGERCPLNIDLEMLAGYSSCSMGTAVLQRLEKRGLIVVRRFQRFREVQITATGKWTTRPASQVSHVAHVPRGMGRARLEAQAGNKARARLEAQAKKGTRARLEAQAADRGHLGASRSPAPSDRKPWRGQREG